MSLSHDAFTFFGHDHGIVTPADDFELPIVRGQFLGVLGESHIISETYGRFLSCAFTFRGYANHGLLADDLQTLSSKQGKLTGTLSMTISGNTTIWPKSTFLGFQSDPRGAFFEGSGVHGYVLFGRLIWRQRSRF